MIKVEHMGVSSTQTKGKKGNHLCPEESTSGQTHEFGSGCLVTELSENKYQSGSVLQNEPKEIPAGVSSSGIHELASVYRADNCSPELPPEEASGHKCADNKISLQESVSEKTGFEYVHKEPSNEKQQSGAEIHQNELEVSNSPVCDLLAKNLPPQDLSKYTQADELGRSEAEPIVDFGSGNVCKELSKQLDKQQELDFEDSPTGIEKGTTAISTNVSNQALQLNPKDVDQGSEKHLQLPPEAVISVIQTSKSSHVEYLGLPQEVTVENPQIQQSRPLFDEMAEKYSVELQESTPKILYKHSACRIGGRTSKTIKKKYVLRSLRSSDRVLRSKSQEKPKATASSNNLADVGSSEQQKRKNKKKKEKRAKREFSNEYAKIRADLRYFLNRINYEQSLIAAYSTEGWKGLSLEKLKPEKELQRATSEILRRKLKIRDLFQRIDSLCVEGRLPESLFDSEGQIDSEDIFCAKCGSKDMSVNNDIILCDGACDRGFHQYCLQPPLLKEDIPPDDEGWLCPGCDCKVDCIELVNESQGTRFSIIDSWEIVFPEAAVAAVGQNQDPNFGLPSDDSDDNDYNPDGSETDEKDEGDNGSSSDESDFTSTSEELEIPTNVDQYTGLPSDDSEDGDYNPDGPDPDDVVKPESSSSDFTSDSEDLDATVEDYSSQQDVNMSNSATGDSRRQRPNLGGKKSLTDELSLIMEKETETASGQDGSAVSKKRSIERLDYKRLYDETYGNAPSSSSDDENWGDATTSTRKRKKHSAESAPAPSNANIAVGRSVPVSDDLKQNPEETTNKPRRKTHHTSKDTDLSPAEIKGDSSVPSSSVNKAGSSTYKRLGEAVKQRLHQFFKENQYPDRATKERLAKELDLTFQQVSKWFDNARWSYHNSPSQEVIAKSVSKNDIRMAHHSKRR